MVLRRRGEKTRFGFCWVLLGCSAIADAARRRVPPGQRLHGVGSPASSPNDGLVDRCNGERWCRHSPPRGCGGGVESLLARAPRARQSSRSSLAVVQVRVCSLSAEGRTSQDYDRVVGGVAGYVCAASQTTAGPRAGVHRRSSCPRSSPAGDRFADPLPGRRRAHTGNRRISGSNGSSFEPSDSRRCRGGAERSAATNRVARHPNAPRYLLDRHAPRRSARDAARPTAPRRPTPSSSRPSRRPSRGSPGPSHAAAPPQGVRCRPAKAGQLSAGANTPGMRQSHAGPRPARP
jgi:hypothetical protein